MFYTCSIAVTSGQYVRYTIQILDRMQVKWWLMQRDGGDNYFQLGNCFSNHKQFVINTRNLSIVSIVLMINICNNVCGHCKLSTSISCHPKYVPIPFTDILNVIVCFLLLTNLKIFANNLQTRIRHINEDNSAAVRLIQTTMISAPLHMCTLCNPS